MNTPTSRKTMAALICTAMLVVCGGAAAHDPVEHLFESLADAQADLGELHVQQTELRAEMNSVRRQIVMLMQDYRDALNPSSPEPDHQTPEDIEGLLEEAHQVWGQLKFEMTMSQLEAEIIQAEIDSLNYRIDLAMDGYEICPSEPQACIEPYIDTVCGPDGEEYDNPCFACAAGAAGYRDCDIQPDTGGNHRGIPRKDAQPVTD